jgi:hypothetical protein
MASRGIGDNDFENYIWVVGDSERDKAVKEE